MHYLKAIFVGLFSWPLIVAAGASAQEPVDYEVIERIKAEAFGNSQVMDVAGILADVYGPRFSNSPSYNRAIQWAQEKFEEFGLDAQIESFGPVGLGWENRYTSVHMLGPEYMTIIAYPVPWSRGTEGRITGAAVFVNAAAIRSDKELEPYRGNVRGKVVFIAPERQLVPSFEPSGERFTQAQLDDWSRFFVLPQSEPATAVYVPPTGSLLGDPLPLERIEAFLETAGASLLVSPGMGTNLGAFDKGTVRVVGGDPISPDDPKPMPHVIVAPEHYNRVVRLLERGVEVTIEAEVRIHYDEEDLQDYNLVAEIPGTDLAHELVMIGGHFDAESAGTGATDNASGSAVVMETMRVLHSIGAQPRRTIRAVLWGSEEAGHLGSRSYINNHFANWETGEPLPDYDNLSVYFNTDWYGRFRGIFLEGNPLVVPIFSAWMKPFNNLGLTHLIPVNTRGTDSDSFNAVGLPGFKFLQDDLEYFTTTWHSNMDVYDRLVAEDLMGNAAILASFAYHAAMRDEKIPRVEKRLINGRRWLK